MHEIIGASSHVLVSFSPSSPPNFRWTQKVCHYNRSIMTKSNISEWNTNKNKIFLSLSLAIVYKHISSAYCSHWCHFTLRHVNPSRCFSFVSFNQRLRTRIARKPYLRWWWSSGYLFLPSLSSSPSSVSFYFFCPEKGKGYSKGIAKEYSVVDVLVATH